ncbi:aldose epimerase family protein [Rhodoblastus sp.]|uniref:aldose epimerase family protein n=1 Tax=Rhodoblastus sp. TaxID=1962975 RepID=UPI003F97CD86
MTAETIALANDYIAVEIAALGAELRRLRDKAGRDFLWSGDPQYWNGRAPLLFPMVGRAAGDHIKIGGKSFPLPQHGFARRSQFETVSGLGHARRAAAGGQRGDPRRLSLSLPARHRP